MMVAQVKVPLIQPQIMLWNIIVKLLQLLQLEMQLVVRAVEKVLTLWSIGMYLVFGYYFIEILNNGNVEILQTLAKGSIEAGWLQGGILYAMYNLAIAPVLLFSTRAIQSRSEAILAGVIAGVAVMVPAVLFHISYAVGYPQVLEQPVPNYWMMSEYASPVLLIVFLVALLGTLVETGAGLVQGLIERIEMAVKVDANDTLSQPARAAIAIATLLFGGLVGSLGIVALVAQGYSALSVGFALVYIIPICTLGVVKIIKSW